MQFLADNGIKQKSYDVKDKHHLEKILDYLIEYSDKGHTFLLHIVSHGDSKGLYTNEFKEFIKWDKLSEYFLIINKNMNNQLIINMTSCFGINVLNCVDLLSTKNPFFGIIGYDGVLGSDIAQNFNQRFYKNMSDNPDIPKALDNAKKKIDDDNFYCCTIIDFKAKVNKILNKLS